MDTLIILASASRPTCLESQIKVPLLLYSCISLRVVRSTETSLICIEFLFYPVPAMARFTQTTLACIGKASIDLVARRSQGSLQEHLYCHQRTQVCIDISYCMDILLNDNYSYKNYERWATGHDFPKANILNCGFRYEFERNVVSVLDHILKGFI